MIIHEEGLHRIIPLRHLTQSISDKTHWKRPHAGHLKIFLCFGENSWGEILMSQVRPCGVKTADWMAKYAIWIDGERGVLMWDEGKE